METQAESITVGGASAVTRDDYCLVHMPVFDIQFPPLGLGLLQAILQSGGLRGRVNYASLQFV